MRVKAFHVGDGDCLLLSATKSTTGLDHHILVDGGRKEAFRNNARDEIYQLDELDLVYVSHIDDDHISGTLVLFDDMVKWRVHDQRPDTTQPSFPRPPDVAEIWHNSLFELVGDDLEPQIPGALSSTAGILLAADSEPMRDLGLKMDNLATGEKASMELSRRVSSRQLGIRRNRRVGEPLKLGTHKQNTVGPFHIKVLGPSEQALEDLKVVWRDWIATNKKAMRELQARMLEDEDDLGTLPAQRVANPLLEAALGEGSITEPNLASLTMYMSANGKTLLLGGDASSEDLIVGLEDKYGSFQNGGTKHIDAVKVQHHGASANVTQDFIDRVTADHYIFCGNGAHHNPEKEVVEAIAKARLGIGRDPVGPDAPFKLWFTSSSASDITDNQATQMKLIENTVAALQDDATATRPGTLRADFLKAGHFEIDLDQPIV
ncbi:MAG: hypothetical protein HKN91_14455 [Acidimicrobiia bacterium]|nr:hypothetical protein [Acidimicrobiia bacterium]